jgi:hypothetical protein
MTRWGTGALWIVALLAVATGLGLACAEDKDDDGEDDNGGGGGKCAMMVDSWYDNCDLTLETSDDVPLDFVAALDECVNNWSGFWECLWDCYNSTLSCADFEECGRGC